MSPQERAEQLEKFRSGYDDLVAVLPEFPRDMWQFKPSPTDWSICEIIHHIADAEVRAYIRFRQAVVEPGKPIAEWERDNWATTLDYHAQSTDDALELFRLLRVLTFNVLQALPDEAWSRTVVHPARGDLTLDDVLGIYARHVGMHVEQMREVKAAWEAASK